MRNCEMTLVLLLNVDLLKTCSLWSLNNNVQIL